MKKINDHHFIYVVGAAVFLYIYMATVDKTYIQYSNLIFTGLLVLVTALYTVFTKKIISENQTDRKITHISKQLEELYYPLSNILNVFEEKSLDRNLALVYADEIEMRDVTHNLTGKSDQNYTAKYTIKPGETMPTESYSKLTVKKYLFMPNTTTRKIFEDFSDSVQNSTLKGNIAKQYDKLKKAVEADIGTLESDLNKLTSGE